jgi:hypothetical protein
VEPKVIIFYTPGRDDRFDTEFLRKVTHPPVWVPIEWRMDDLRKRLHETMQPALTASTADAVCRFAETIQLVGRTTYHSFQGAFSSAFALPEPGTLPNEEDPKTRNKVGRKKREAAKASQNARGRKWWEHR